MAKRTVQQVIDSVISENRSNEYLLYVFAGIFVLLGTAAFIYSIVTAHWALSIGSAIESGLFYPAVVAVQSIRRENQQIRLMEIPLNNAATAVEAAAALHKAFTHTFGDNRGVANVRTKTQGR